MTQFNFSEAVKESFSDDVNKLCDIMHQCNNDVTEAVKQYLSEFKLSEGNTVDSVAESIVSTARDFCVSVDKYDFAGEQTEEQIEGAIAEMKRDYREQLESTIAEMDSEKAYAYLATLSVLIKSCNKGAVAESEDVVLTPQELEAEIKGACEGISGKSIDECIDELVNELDNSDMAAFMYVAGNEELVNAISDPEQLKENAALGEAVAGLMSNVKERFDQFAIVACATYGQILRGNVEGVTVENADPKIVAAVACAAMEKDAIVRRLTRGEITMKVAMALLRALGIVLKEIITAAITVLILASTSYIIMSLFAGLVALLGVAGTVVEYALMIVGLACSVYFTYTNTEDIADYAESLTDLAEEGIKAVARFVFGRGKEAEPVVDQQEEQPVLIETVNSDPVEA